MAGLQILFFIAACMLPCCRFVTETVLITLLLSNSNSKQCLHNVKATSVSHAALPGVGWGWAGVWEGSTAGRADPDWPKGYFMPYHSRLSNKAGGWSSQGSCCLGTGWALICWWKVLSGCLCKSLGFLKTLKKFFHLLMSFYLEPFVVFSLLFF